MLTSSDLPILQFIDTIAIAIVFKTAAMFEEDDRMGGAPCVCGPLRNWAQEDVGRSV